MTALQTRRRFLQLGGLSAVSCALPGCASWSARGATSPLRIVFFTDIHARTEWQTPQALEIAARAINREHADLVLAGGDLITDGFQSSALTVAPRGRTYLEMHHTISPQPYPVLGNHDLVAALPEDGSRPSDDPRRQFLEHFKLARTYRAFDAGGVHFILLDSVDLTGGDLKYRGFIDSQQLEWLDHTIARIPQGEPIVVASHLPLLTGFYQRTMGAAAAAPANRIVTNSLEVLDRFSEHNLLLVLQGHLHVDELLRWRGTTFITGGAVCGKWWRGAWHGTRNGYGVVTLRKDRVDWRYVNYPWQARRP